MSKRFQRLRTSIVNITKNTTTWDSRKIETKLDSDVLLAGGLIHSQKSGRALADRELLGMPYLENKRIHGESAWGGWEADRTSITCTYYVIPEVRELKGRLATNQSEEP